MPKLIHERRSPSPWGGGCGPGAARRRPHVPVTASAREMKVIF